MEDLIYIPGEGIPSGPLSRFLPPVPRGMAAALLAQHLPGVKQGAWVLDPFGAAPHLAVEMARSGWQVLVAVNNPVTRFLLEMTANPPTRAELQGALADLGSARKGDERLETHLSALYQTECSRCHKQVNAEAFVWEREGKAPTNRIYRCPCGESGEFPVTEADRELSTRIAATAGLHHARALERVTNLDDPDRPQVEEALNCYLPRAVYALTTIINKLDALPMPPNRRRCLQALILATCDQINTQWAHPEDRPRPKQFSTPARYLERNAWLVLEQSVDLWAGTLPGIPVVAQNELPPESGGICLFEGPVRDLVPRLGKIPLQAVVTAIPRPNQAFWTFSALWAGWLWGQEAVGPFRSVLHRRRYDWNWHSSALQAAFKSLATVFPPSAPFFGLVAEAEPSYLTAALAASEAAGFDLRGLAMRTVQDPVQLLWQRRLYTHLPGKPSDPKMIREALLEALATRGEPVPYLHLHATALAKMAEEQALTTGKEELSSLQAPIQEALAGEEFVHYSGSQSVESGLWGLKNFGEESLSLPDQVERLVVKTLMDSPGMSLPALEKKLNTGLPGTLTPSLGLVRAVLESYATEENGGWQLRPEETGVSRRNDLEEAAEALKSIGERLGYRVSEAEKPLRMVQWKEQGRIALSFHLGASAGIGKELRLNRTPPEHSLLVLPGGRSALLAYKLRRDPDLSARWDAGWRVVKFRALRRLVKDPSLTRERFAVEIASDPIESPEQMKLF